MRPSRPPSPTAALAVAMAAAAALLLWESRGQTFFADEWAFFAGYRGLAPDVLLQSHAGNLHLAPALIYKSSLALFGDSYLPLRLIWAGLDLVCAGLFFQLARRRVGDWAALAPATLLLFLGAAWEVLGGPLGITILLTVACGLGMLLCLERGDPSGDLGACLLLAVALASYSAALAFAAGAALYLLVLSGTGGRQRFWVVVVPLVLYGAWRIWAIQFHDTDVSLDNVLGLPGSLAASLAATVASISGTFRDPGASGLSTAPNFRTEAGWVLGVALVAAAAVRLLRPPRRPADPWVWVFVAMPLVYWALIGINLAPGRAPEASRYQYPGAVFVLLLGVQLWAGVRLSWRGGAALAGALLFCLLGNVGNLHDAGSFLRRVADQNRAELGALELVRAHVPAERLIEPLDSLPVPPGDVTAEIEVRDLVIGVGDYLAAADDFGSPAYPASTLPGRSEDAREFADAELVQALGLAPGAAPPRVPGAGVVRADAVEGGFVRQRGGCLRFLPRLADAHATFTVPRAGFSIDAVPGPAVAVEMRRFGDAFVARLPAPATGAPQLVGLPRDGSAVAWHTNVTASVPVTVCPA